MFVPFAPWRPDVGGPNKPYSPLARGGVPQAASSGVGYGPFPSLVTATGAEALSGAPRGVISFQKTDGSWAVVGATAAKLELLDASYQWSDIETGRTVTAGDDVSFAPFGAYLLNTDTTSGFKAYNYDTPAGNNSVSGAPAARAVCVCNNVVFALGTSSNPRRMQSSGVGDHTAWTTKGADGKTFEDGGALVGMRDLKNGNGVIFQERAIRLVQFGQGAALYSVGKVADGRGAVADRTIVGFDGTAFWWDTDGPWQFTVGGGLIPIGAEKINRWLEANVGASNYENLQGVVDPTRSLVIWRVDATYALAYNWLIKDWSILPMVTSTLTRLATAGVTINDLSGTIDSQTLTINNRLWQGGAPGLGALDGSYKFATFAGPNMAATLETAVQAGMRSKLIKWASPQSDAPNSTLSVGWSDTIAADLTWDDPVGRLDDGRVPLRTRGKNIAFRESIPAGEQWTFANGIDQIVLTEGGPK